jgi:hypothetical protein
MEWAAFSIALLSLGLSLYLLLRPQESRTIERIFAAPEKHSKKGKRPIVRDELAGWRAEQREKFEWEAELKERGLE